jgi:hypothetical protein
MKAYATLTAAACLVGLTSLCQAGQIVSPALPTDTNTAGACYIRNLQSTPISLQVQLFQSSTFDIPPTFENCNTAPLAAGRTCVVLVNDLPDGVHFACSATASSVLDKHLRKRVRGTVELRTILPGGGLQVRIAEDLR